MDEDDIGYFFPPNAAQSHKGSRKWMEDAANCRKFWDEVEVRKSTNERVQINSVLLGEAHIHTAEVVSFWNHISSYRLW